MSNVLEFKAVGILGVDQSFFYATQIRLCMSGCGLSAVINDAEVK